MRMAAHQKLLLERLEKQAEQNASTTNLLSRILDRDRVSVPHEIPPVAPLHANEPSVEPPIFIPISAATAQGEKPGATATANGADAGQQASQPIVEKVQPRPRWWR